MNHILLIEDEQSVATVIKGYLEKAGYKVSSVQNGLKGLDVFKTADFKLIILDLMLPDISGEEVCKIIRQTSDVHIFMLTAKGSLNDKIEGLNIGADEYLIKPFSPRELTARVNALFRRIGSKFPSSKVIFDDGYLLIDCDKRAVRILEQAIPFTPNEFDIICALVTAKGNVLSREQLIDKIFGVDFSGYDRTIDVHIKNIRKKIEKDTKNPKYIVTVMKAGYKFGGEK
ncbi:response regulator transcription factor [Neobacillus niacini]|uniref:response regulator transcription factor n=1 Tax=Neobacillus niacini TaxID=86668 RepID=UPI002FFFD1D0